MLNITRVRSSCTVFAAQAEAMDKPKSSSHCCLLCVRCVKLRKSRIKNLSRRLFHMLNLFRCSFHLCPTVMTTSSGAICIYLVSESEVCKSCTVLLRQQCSHGETFCGWQCAQNRETCSSTRIRREKNARVEPLQPEECHRKPEAGRCLGAHLAIR